MDWVDYAVYVAVTALLLVNVARRAPARQADTRPWVWLLCSISTAYWLLYDVAEMAWWIFAWHWLGDAALLYLGRSFAVLPALRDVKTGGPYAVVRHPIYASYLIADAAYCAVAPSAWNVGVAVLGATTLLLRIELEEQVLRRDPAYLRYAQRTRFRVLPFLY